jgi:beta-glucosidase
MKISGFVGFCLLAILGVSSPAQEKAKYLDSTLGIEQRIDDLLPRMTTEEKISQIWDSWGSQGISRLGVPPLLKTEGLHSQSYSTGATIFPQSIAMASTFDPTLIGEVGKQTAVESKAANLRASWSPVLDVVRDVRWGRTEETYGESPYLVSRMGVAWIEGFQSLGMIAVPKHFAGHGGPVGGRDSQDYGLSDRTMREIFLPPYRAAVEEAHAGGVMAAYSLWDGVPDNASIPLLQHILRQEWGFDGMVVSDCGGPEHFITKHAIVRTPEEAVVLAAAAGVNMECGAMYKTAMLQAVHDGLVSEAELDDVARPTLRTKFKLGLFDHPTSGKMIWDKLPEYDTTASRALANKVETEGAVLLRNEHVLPLRHDLKTIAVIGPDADLGQTGDYSPKLSPGQCVTVLQGIRSHAGAGTNVLYAPGLATPASTDTSKFAEAVDAAKKANVAVVVVGDNSRNGGGESTTGENIDGATLEFSGAQRDLIKAIYATGTPVVLVIVNGKPFTLAWEAEHLPGILVTWYPGEDGGNATAELLFGDKNPSGHLPITWPRSPAQLPLNYDYHPSGRRYSYYDMPFTPQYRFGFGLSYTHFVYSNLRILPKAGDPGFVTVMADVQNAGTRDGDVVAQLYVTDKVASVSTPVIELKGMQRLPLKAGEAGTVKFELTPYQLSVLDEDMVRRVEPGTFRIHVGNVSPDVQTNVTDERKAKIGFFDPAEGITSEFNEPKAYSAHFSYKLQAPEKPEIGQEFAAAVVVKNDGNLTDVAEAKLYDSVALGSWSFELKPGEEKSHVFHVAVYKSGQLALIGGNQMVSAPLVVVESPARLEFKNEHLSVDENANLQVTADAHNVGSLPYDGTFVLKIDGQPEGEPQQLSLQSGEGRKVMLSHAFSEGGLHHVQLGNMPEQLIQVPGGISLALLNPVLDLKLDEGKGAVVKNEINGEELALKGSPEWVKGKEGSGLRPASSSSIDAGNVQLYRKSFTLSAWIKIDKLGNGGNLALFGGRAPMGADQDNTGTVLSAGLHDGKLFLGFQGRSAIGSKPVPLGNWVNVTYVYDASLRKAFLYLNGSQDRAVELEPYAGPLETIGDAPALQHGEFAMDDIAVTESALVPKLVQVLVQNGFDALHDGEYVSGWQGYTGVLDHLSSSAVIPEGGSLSLTIDVGDSKGMVLGSQTLTLKPGSESYALKALKAGGQVRLRVKIVSNATVQSPLLRAVSLFGSAGVVRWSTPKEWSVGSAGNRVVLNDPAP